MTDFVGTNLDDTLTIGTGQHTVDGRRGIDTLVINWSTLNQGIFGGIGSSGVSGSISGGASSIFFNNIERLIITSGGGNDTLYGLALDDTLSGGIGADTIYGGAGNDTLNGDGGDDTLDSGTGIDVVNGGSGRDLWLANYEDFTTDIILLLNTTSTTVTGGTVLNSIERIHFTAGSGNDQLTGGQFDDAISGGAGNDVIDVGRGIDSADGGIGIDTLIVNWATSNLDINAAINTNGQSGYYGDDGGNFVSFNNFERLNFTSGGGNDVLRGLAMNDTLSGGLGADTLFGGAGDDTLNGDGGDDTLDSGAGIDVVNGGSGRDLWSANYQEFTTKIILLLNTTSTTVTGGTVLNSIERIHFTAGSGNDQLTGGQFDDAISGGAGNDVIDVGRGIDSADGGIGIDTLIVNWATSNLDINAAINTNGQSGYYGDDGGNFVSFNNFERLNFTSGGGNDVLRGLAMNDVLKGGGGADFLFGGAGDDTLIGGSGDDTLDSGTGSDVVNGGSGRDIWIGNYQDSVADILFVLNTASTAVTGGTTLASIERVNFTAGSGNDQLTGGQLDDTFSGGAGNDVLKGLEGDDFLFGNQGDDELHVGSGNDTVNGGSGLDRLVIDWSTMGSAVYMAANSNGTSGAVSSNIANTVSFTAVEAVTMSSGTGNDVLVGLINHDIIVAGAGNDTVNGMDGNDILTGGSGLDTFVFSGNWGTDTIMDFTNGSDKLDLRPLGVVFGDILVNASGNDTVLTLAGEAHQIILKNVSSNLIDVTDFLL